MRIFKSSILFGALASGMIFSGASAFAAGQESQLLFFQAGPGQLAISAGMTKSNASIDLTVSGAAYGNAKFDSSLTQLAIEYGLSNTMSLEFNTDQGTEETTVTVISPAAQSTDKYSGMGDLGVLAKFNLDSGSMLFRFQGGLNVNNGNKEEPTATKDGTRSSGGLSVPLILGAGYKMGSSIVGVRASYDNFMERKTDSGSSITTRTGGNLTTVKGFLEYNSGLLSAALSAGTYTEAESIDKAANGTETTNKAVTGSLLNVDLGFSVSKNLTLLASYELNTSQREASGVDNYTQKVATFGGGIRLLF